jgi:hypothetical protein
VTIELPNNDIARAASKGVDRRTLLKAGAWAAPVLVLTTAAPAMAASIEPVPAAQLTVTSGLLTVSATPATPLNWAGGKIVWTPPTSGGPTSAMVSYTVILSGPAGFTSETLYTGSANLTAGGSVDFPAGSYGTAAVPPGQYTITVAAVSDGTASASSTATVVYTVSISAFTGIATAGQGSNSTYALSFTVTNSGPIPVTVSVALGGTGFSTNPTPANFTSLVVPAGGSVTQPVSPSTISAATANQSIGKTATATISAPAGWTVQNSSHTFKGGASF